jgi:CubicO group peptidase (beta-lactamase class C family)
VLAEQGVLDYDTPIAEVWPAFAAHGKSSITLRHALSQSAGVPGLPQDITIDDLPDWEKMCATVAGETPWWEAGTKVGYHAITWGFLVGEFVRRVTGSRISGIVREQVAAPLGIEHELMLAVPTADLDRVAVNEDAPMEAPQGDGHDFEMPIAGPMFRIGPWEATSAAYGNRADVRQADIPAGGTVTARSVARMYAALLGRADGVRLISPQRLEQVSAVAASGEDQVFGFPTAWGLGRRHRGRQHPLTSHAARRPSGYVRQPLGSTLRLSSGVSCRADVEFEPDRPAHRRAVPTACAGRHWRHGGRLPRR